MSIDVYELEGDFHREALIGRLVVLGARVSFEHLELLLGAAQHWAVVDAPPAPTLSLVADAAERPIPPRPTGCDEAKAGDPAA